MGVVKVGFSAALMKAAIEQTGARVVKHGIDVMRDEAQKIAELARDYAPHDEGKLEEAIEVLDEGGGRDEGGRLLRKSVAVQVNPNAPGSGGMVVGDYAYLMHEGLGPYGEGIWNLGKRSVEKDAGRGVVGGKFLERAIDARKTELSRRLEEMYQRKFG